IHRKMMARELELDQVGDLRGVRVIVDTVDRCYAVQRALYENWPVVTSMYGGKKGRDWIKTPKPNGYQSLHTPFRMGGRKVQVQIRTNDMHNTAEYGAAAHWTYEEGALIQPGDRQLAAERRRRDLIEQMAKWTELLKEESAASESVRIPIESNWVYVITPKG